MRYRNILFVFFIVQIFLLEAMALDIKIYQDKKIITKPQDIVNIKRFFKEKYHFVFNSDADARKIVKENRILANLYIKSPEYSKGKGYIIILLEDLFAKNYVHSLQQKIHLNDNILKSYYLDHKEEFKESDQIDAILYSFDKYEDAFKFFETNKDKGSPVAGGVEQKIPYDTLAIPFQKVIKKEKDRYYTPPIVSYRGKIYVLFIKKYIKSPIYKPYKEVKEQIRKILFDKTFLREKEKVLRQYEKKVVD